MIVVGKKCDLHFAISKVDLAMRMQQIITDRFLFAFLQWWRLSYEAYIHPPALKTEAPKTPSSAPICTTCHASATVFRSAKVMETNLEKMNPYESLLDGG